MKRAATAFISTVFAIVWAFLCFLPLPTAVFGAQERYWCVWRQGETTQENYFTAYSDFAGISEAGNLMLERGGDYGEIVPSEAFLKAVAILDAGSLAELVVFEPQITRLEHMALYRKYQSRLWYEGEFYGYTGSRIERVKPVRAEEVVLLAGTISPRTLADTGATCLHLRAEAELTAKTLARSSVSTVIAEAPYSASGGAICLDASGGKRLLAGVPAETEIVLPADLEFADEGALLLCTRLSAITVPFVGSTKNTFGTNYRGMFAHLFSTGTEYRVPESLKAVRVTGGMLIAHAFYRCNQVEEINACGLLPANISREAFVDCASLKLLHTPRADVQLSGTFQSRSASCGCTVYERI